MCKIDIPRNRTTIPDVLAIAFVILKLTGHIDWSWWWVLSPIWITIIVLSIIGAE